MLWCRGCTTSPPLCPLLPSGHGASSSTGAVTAYRSSTKNEISYAMNKVSTTHAKTMVLLRSRKGMILALFETCGPISHVWLPSTHYRRQASRLSGAEAAGRPGTWQPASVRRSSRPSRRGRGPISAGSGTRASMTGAGTRTCRSVLSEGRPSGLVAGASASFDGMGRGARAPASPGAPAPGARQGHPGSPGGRAKRQRAQTAHRACAPLPLTRTVRESL